MRVRVSAALASVAVLLCGAAGAAQTTTAPTPGPVIGPTATPGAVPAGGALPAGGPVALDARSLRGTRTTSGYRLAGQALVKDACTAARFVQFMGNVFPPFFNVVQYRRPGTMGMLCIQRLTRVTIQPLNVTSAAPPRWVTVHTQKGSARVQILPIRAY